MRPAVVGVAGADPKVGGALRPDGLQLRYPCRGVKPLPQQSVDSFANPRRPFIILPMRTVQITTVKTPMAVASVPDPAASPGQAIVRLKAAALNHRDLFI